MKQAGYETLVCNIFTDWENVKDEILPQDRKSGSGNGTIHVFLGAADTELQKEFSKYYSAVSNGEDPAVSAVKITHYFLVGNLISASGFLCQYYFNRKEHFEDRIDEIFSTLNNYPVQKEGLISCESLFKLSTGSSRLRPYFKHFDSRGVFSKVVRPLLLPESSYKISLYKNSNGQYAAFWLIGFKGLLSDEVNADIKHIRETSNSVNLRELFESYLKNQKGLDVKTIGFYINGLEKISQHLKEHSEYNFDYDSVFKCDDAVIMENIISRLQNDGTIQRYLDEKKWSFRAGLNNYLAFLRQRNDKQLNNSILFNHIKSPRQLIYYGAPGTGKSYKINQITKDNPNVIRTTFHPDSDYSTFVGAYKPTMRNYKVAGSSYKLDGDSLNDNKEEIAYEFVPQAFLQAYVNAWKLLTEATDENSIQPEFLVIEEINRGNCAQIFGDLFQLLDRRNDGFSDYPIHADRDLQGYLRKIFQDEWLKKSGEKEDTLKASLNRIYGKEEDVKRVLDGEILLLPCNLYIWATMNTSDQSLFPIDSAFKRRWDWKYVPISRGKDKDGNPLQWKIKAGDKEYDWWSFLKKINERIYKATESEDKQLGYFFCKAGQNGCITTERFVNKVLFYLWNDVFKDYDTKDVFPEDYPTFDRFFTEDGNADDTAVESFLHGLELESVTTEPQTARISETSGEKVE